MAPTPTNNKAAQRGGEGGENIERADIGPIVLDEQDKKCMACMEEMRLKLNAVPDSERPAIAQKIEKMLRAHIIGISKEFIPSMTSFRANQICKEVQIRMVAR